jgi:GNAT superfamily N-acetyltransferase
MKYRSHLVAVKVRHVTDLATGLIAGLERTYDAIPREGGATVEPIGPFELFLRQGAGWPYYARPRLSVTTVTTDDVEAVRARQRALGVPEAIEWVHEITPDLQAAAEATGLYVLRAPLMVLDPDRLPNPAALTDAELSILDPDSADFPRQYALSSAVANVGFGAAGTQRGGAGPADRDAAVTEPDEALLAVVATGLRSGRTVEAVATTPSEGIVARGASQRALGAAEIVGVATLPSTRRRGLGAAVSALLAHQALDSGAQTVFLSAADEDVARVYGRIGFVRIGTACIAEPGPTH